MVCKIKIQYHNQSGDDDSHSATPVVSEALPCQGRSGLSGSAASGFACVFVFAVLFAALLCALIQNQNRIQMLLGLHKAQSQRISSARWCRSRFPVPCRMASPSG